MPLDFGRVNRAALSVLRALLRRWLPGGKFEGREYIVRNPRRADEHPGSFSINVTNGRWADFAATGDARARGGDPVSLLAYLDGSSQGDAARKLAAILGVAL
jgi:hypothetical protein